MLTVERAFDLCEEITRREAKNFAYGIRLLPAPKRRAMSALYAYARRIDDIADGELPLEDKLSALNAVDAEVEALAASSLPDSLDPVLVGVHAAMTDYEIPVGCFGEIVEGCRHDVNAVGYATFGDTEDYCRLVAGSVGRLSLGVFGSTVPYAPLLADDLGVALQLTNILRDIVEDREMGRVYLPADDIASFGCAPDLTGPPDDVVKLVVHFVAVAESFYERGLPLLDLLDRRSRSCVAAMAGIYHQLLHRIGREPESVLRGRLSLPTSKKLWVAARSLTGIAS